jgi:TetR/AcrR family transcriptional regulator, regulator of mycofactocin system
VRGRPRRVTHAEISRTALELFARHGFEQTTVDDIAAALAINRRTVFRYFRSKNDMVWGDFDWVLNRLRRYLSDTRPNEPLMPALARAVVASNQYGPDELAELRIRMTLITTVPALQAHSMLRYAAWRAVIADFVAGRLGQRPDDLVPQTIAHACLGTSMAVFVRWVDHPDEDLQDNLRGAYELLCAGFRLG